MADLSTQAAQAEQQSQESNSLSGMFKNAVSSAFSTVKDYVTGSVSQAKDVGAKLAADPFGTVERGYLSIGQHSIDAASASFGEGKDAMTNMLTDYKNGTGSTAGDVANLAKLTSSVAGVLFSPISGTFATAEKIPVLKQIADAINIPFTVTGVAASYGTGKIFDIIPKEYLSQESKDVLKKPVQDLASLAAQVVIGGKIMAKVGDLVKSGRPVTEAEAHRIVAEVQTENAPVFTPENNAPHAFQPTKLTHEEYARSQGYEPYVAPDELPTIQAGKGSKAPAENPDIQIGEPLSQDELMRARGFEKYTPDAELPTIQASGRGKTTYKPEPLEQPKKDAAVADSYTIEPIKDSVPPEKSAATLYKDLPKELKGKALDQEDFTKKILPKLENLPIPKEGQTLIFRTGDGEWTDTDLKTALNRGVNETTQVKIVPTEDLKTTGNPAKDARGERLLQPTAAEAPKETSGLAKSVNKDAIKAGLDTGLGSLPEYSRMDMKEQAKMAGDLIAKDPGQAMRVALGDEPSPTSHLLPESVYTALRITARDAGDIETLRRLALESKIVNNATAMGQRIKALDSGQLVDPVTIIQDVKESRAKNIESKSKGTTAKTKKAIVDDIKTELKKTASKRPGWEEFIKEVQCDY